MKRRDFLKAGVLAAMSAAAKPSGGLSLSGPTETGICAGETVPLTYTLTKGPGQSLSTTFSVSGLPSGITGTFSPTSCKGGCGTTLTLRAASNYVTGSYSFIVRAQNSKDVAMANTNIKPRCAVSYPPPPSGPPLNSPAFFISPTGNDSTGDGSINNPWATVGKFHTVAASPGDTLYVRGGACALSAQISLTKSGAAGQTIKIFAYPGETPVFDGATQPNNNNIFRLPTGVQYWYFKGLECKNAATFGFSLEGTSSDITIENCSIHHNMRIAESGAGINTDFGGNVVILNCDFHHNGHSGSEGGSGFASASTASGNVVRGCRAWRNNDNGYALFTAANWLMENNWAWENGYDDSLNSTSPGDGVAFKLGGLDTGGSHIIRYNLAWNNRSNGFDVNTAPDPMTIYSNTARNNGGSNFLFYGGAHVLRNNLAQGSVSITAPADAQFNSWNLAVTVSDADFLSTDFTANTGARKADGSLPDSNFLRLTGGSDLIDKGTDVGLPFNGSAPDLGAYET